MPLANWELKAICHTTTPQMFHALRIPLKRGRLLDKSDIAERPFVAVINETAARLYWPGADPIGKLHSGRCQTISGNAQSGCSTDGSMGKVRNGGDLIGPNPTDRAKRGSKKPAGPWSRQASGDRRRCGQRQFVDAFCFEIVF